MPKYKLNYFNLAGRGEIPRIIFHHVGVEFTDHRIQMSDWPDLKKDNRLFPFGKVPTLEVDDHVIAQSMAIIRYMADEFGLAGKDNLERARANMIADGLLELFPKFGAFMFERDEAKKEELKKTFFEITVPSIMEVIERLLSENNGGKGYFVGNDITWVDILLFDVADKIKEYQSNFLDIYPLLKKLKERVGQLPKIKAYVESR